MKYLSITLLLILFSCDAKVDMNVVEPNDETGFIHTVFFWMKEDVTQEAIKEFNNVGLKELAKIESLYKCYYGPPAGTSRDVIDGSYTVAWVCHFKNAEDEALYQKDPLHLAFIEKYKDLWDKVVVYDNLVNFKQ